MSAEAADLMAPAGLARRALILVSALAPNGVPGMVLTGAAACEYLTGQPGDSPAQRAQVSAALHSLARAGLISLNPGSAAGTVLVPELGQICRRLHGMRPGRKLASSG